MDCVQRYPVLQPCQEDLQKGFQLLCNVFQVSKKWLVAGNGGSASDADHIAGECLKAFRIKQEPKDLPKVLAKHLQHALPVLPLADFSGIYTAYTNDCEPEWAFAQLVYGLGGAGDGLWAISTSGHSANICHAAEVARAKHMHVLGLSGQSGGSLKALCDVCVCVPETETYKVQELHVPIYHTWCRMLEEHFFGEEIHFPSS